MAVLRIYDLQGRVLAFDLRHILDLLAPRSITAQWTVSAVSAVHSEDEWFETTGDGGDGLDALMAKGGRLSGRDLVTLARSTRQVIWGEFTAYLPGSPQEPWVTVRAIDSTFYEVITTDTSMLSAVGSAFKDVRPVEAAWTQQPL